MKFLKRIIRAAKISFLKFRLPRLDEGDTEVLREIKLVLFDFDGVFTRNSVIVDQSGTESVECSRLDGLGLSRLKAHGIMIRVVSTEANPVVTARCKKLGIDVSQCVDDKEKEVLKLTRSAGLNLKQVMFVGNDINDLPAFRAAGVAVAVNDAYPDILDSVGFITTRKGGEGCVREICDILSKISKERRSG